MQTIEMGKDKTFNLRLDEADRAKLEDIADVRMCSNAEAIRLIIAEEHDRVDRWRRQDIIAAAHAAILNTEISASVPTAMTEVARAWVLKLVDAGSRPLNGEWPGRPLDLVYACEAMSRKNAPSFVASLLSDVSVSEGANERAAQLWKGSGPAGLMKLAALANLGPDIEPKTKKTKTKKH